MADNTQLNSGSGGDILASASLTISGDTAVVQMDSGGLLTGSEGSWAYSSLVGGAGAVAAGVQRVTLASDDPAVTAIQLIDDAIYVDDATWSDGSSKHLLVGGLYQSVPQSITDGDVGPMQVTANGYAIVSVNGTVTVGSHAVTNAGTFVTQVDGAALTALQLIDNIVLAEDASHISGASGVMPLGVRNDTLAALAGADGDYAPLQVNASGALYTAISGSVTVSSHAVTNAGTFAVQVDGAALTALQLLDDVVYVDDATWSDGSSKHLLVGGVYQTSPNTISDGDVGPLQVTANGYAIVSVNGTVTVGSHAVTNAGTFAVQSTLQAGSNTFGKLAANSGVDIGDVDILSVIAGTGPTNLGKAEDGDHISGDTGVMALSVRKNTAAATSGSDGDYQPLITDTNGRLHTNDISTAAALSGSEFQVDIVASLPAGTNGIGKLTSNSGTDIGDVDILSIVAGVGVTNLGKAVDAAAGGTDTGVMSLSVRKNTAAATGGSDGDYQPLITDTNGRLHVNDVSTAAALSGSEFQVDIVGSLPAGTNGIGKLTANSGTDIGDVDVTSIVSGTAATNLGKAVDSAAGGTDTGVAMLAVRDDEKAALVADGDYIVPRADKFGALRVTGLPDSTSEIKHAKIDAASSGNNTLVAAAGGGIKIRVLSAFVLSAGTCTARFEDGADGTALTGQMSLVANSGFVLPYNEGGWFEGTDNTLLNLELSAGVSVDGSLSYVEV